MYGCDGVSCRWRHGGIGHSVDSIGHRHLVCAEGRAVGHTMAERLEDDGTVTLQLNGKGGLGGIG